MKLADKFTDELLGLFHQVQKEYAIDVSKEVERVNEQGGIKAAKELVSSDSQLFKELLEKGKLNLTVEAICIKSRYREFFSEDTLKLCHERLVRGQGGGQKYRLKTKKDKP